MRPSLAGFKRPLTETGGVLIGSFDFTRKILYVCHTIPSPPDSEEWPTLYIRGCAGLADQVKVISARTGGQLEYVGEWHSHPDGVSCRPSSDDMKVFSWLAENMAAAGLPAMMAIIGQSNTSRWFLHEISADGGYGIT